MFYTGLEDYDDEIERARKKYIGSQRKRRLKKKNLKMRNDKVTFDYENFYYTRKLKDRTLESVKGEIV